MKWIIIFIVYLHYIIIVVHWFTEAIRLGAHSQVNLFTPSTHRPFPLQSTTTHCSHQCYWVRQSSPVKPGSQAQWKVPIPSMHARYTQSITTAAHSKIMIHFTSHYSQDQYNTKRSDYQVHCYKIIFLCGFVVETLLLFNKSINSLAKHCALRKVKGSIICVDGWDAPILIGRFRASYWGLSNISPKGLKQ